MFKELINRSFYNDNNGVLLHGYCEEWLKELPDNSVDSVVTDPPYGWKFMGKKWDYDLPSVEVWQEVLRVLKPGGYILVACGTKTQHRMAVNIEDAGFEVKDILCWTYGSGFPKSRDIWERDIRPEIEKQLKEQGVEGVIEWKKNIE